MWLAKSWDGFGSLTMLRKHVRAAGLLGALVLWGAGCGGPLEEGEEEQASQGQAVINQVSSTAPQTAPGEGVQDSPARTQEVTALNPSANVPTSGWVTDSQDPIPISSDGRPVSGGGGGNPNPGDPHAHLAAQNHR
jgi:hypothetical protein